MRPNKIKKRPTRKDVDKAYQEGHKKGFYVGINEGRRRQIEDFRQLFNIKD